MESNTQATTSKRRPSSKSAMSPWSSWAPGTLVAATASISGDRSSPVRSAPVSNRARMDPVPHPSSRSDAASGR